MIGFFAAQAMGHSPTPPADPRFIGANYATTTVGSSITLQVPAGGESGDTLIMFCICRGDRSVAAPAGFATIFADQTGVQNLHTRFYVFAKAFSGETSVTATHSVNAAYGASLVLVRGAISQSAGPPMTYNSAISEEIIATGGMLLAFGGYNQYAATSVPDATNPGWGTAGTTVYVTSGTILNYLGYVFVLEGASIGPHVVTPGITHQAGQSSGYLWVAEIG